MADRTDRDPTGPLEVAQVDALLRRHADELRRTARLPAPESLLWRARLRERVARAEMTGRLLSLYDRVAVGVGVAAAAVFVAWNRDAVSEFLRRLGTVSSATPGGASGSAAWISAVGVLALAGLVVWAMSIWSEES